MAKIRKDGSNASEEANYELPHHAVIQEDSLTTRLRVVYNGSAKTLKEKSSNDILMVGLNI